MTAAPPLALLTGLPRPWDGSWPPSHMLCSAQMAGPTASHPPMRDWDWTQLHVRYGAQMTTRHDLLDEVTEVEVTVAA